MATKNIFFTDFSIEDYRVFTENLPEHIKLLANELSTFQFSLLFSKAI